MGVGASGEGGELTETSLRTYVLHAMQPRRRPPQQFLLDITVTDDGIRPVRDAHPWSRDKLGILRSYLAAYAKACQSASEFYFVDAMAGSGLYRIQETNEWLLGSTPIALRIEPRFHKCLALEIDPRNVEALHRRVEEFAGRAIVLQGDCNVHLESTMADHIPRRSPSFVLLDPEGAELEWSTVRMASTHRQGPLKSELLILFATEGINRMLPVEADITVQNEWRLDHLFPDGGWRDIWSRRKDGELTPAQARGLYVENYCEGLRSLGYQRVIPRAITRGSTADVVYHLVFATDHPAGERIMADVFANMNSNQPQLRLDF